MKENSSDNGYQPANTLPRFAVIVAGGSGTRMGGGLPKQFRKLCNRPVLWWSMKRFHEENRDTRIILVLPEEFITLWQDIFSALPKSEQFEHLIATGGSTRSESVKRGLSLIQEEDSLVAVHDGARPLISTEIISTGWEIARRYEAAIPVVAVSDSLRKVSGSQNQTVDRNEFVAVQTPQVFKTLLLKEAYAKADNKIFTDDAAVVENAGHRVSLFDGSYNNIKITNPKDLEIAKVLMEDA